MKAHAFVRIPCRSHAEATELALRLQADEYGAVRRWKAVIVSTETRDEAELLARKLETWAAPDTTRIWESAPRSPAAILMSGAVRVR